MRTEWSDKELRPFILFLPAYLLHQPGNVKEMQFIITDQTATTPGSLRHSVKKLHTNALSKTHWADVWGICNWEN